MEINHTLLIQVGIFLYVLVVLNFLFFKPLLAIVRKREELTVGRDGAAADFRKQMEDLQEKYDREVGAAKASLEEQRHETIKRNREIAERKVQEAKQRMERQFVEKLAVVEQEHARVQQKLSGLSEGVAKDIVQSMLNSRVVRP